MARKPEKITVTKLDAARRQIETAISLWFQDGDPVSIRTLTAAGNQVCRGLMIARGEDSPFFLNEKLIRPDKWEDYKRLMLLPENFFKHTTKKHEKHPDAKLEFAPKVTEAYLIDAIKMYSSLHGSVTLLMRAFWFRFIILNPHTSTDFLPLVKNPACVYWRKLSKATFLEEFIKAPPWSGEI